MQISGDADPAMPQAVSPCLRVCKYNENQNCFGCFRTLAEVRTWNTMTVAEREAVTAELTERRARYWDRYNTDGST